MPLVIPRVSFLGIYNDRIKYMHPLNQGLH